jgi:hypothetical protein
MRFSVDQAFQPDGDARTFGIHARNPRGSFGLASQHIGRCPSLILLRECTAVRLESLTYGQNTNRAVMPGN